MSEHCVHGGSVLDALGAGVLDAGWRDAVRADVLDAWYPPAPLVPDYLRANLDWLVATSPPTLATALRDCIAGSCDVAPECIVTGAGSSELLYAALPRLLHPAQPVVLCAPQYGEYEHLLGTLKIEARKAWQSAQDGFAFHCDTVVTAARAAQAVVLVNPCNPTGQVAQREVVLELAQAIAPRLLIVDETYADFAEGGVSVLGDIETQPNVVVLKSMSKYYALSGLRVGFMASNAHYAERIRSALPPWSVSFPAQVAAMLALTSADYYSQRAVETRTLRAQLSAQLSTLPGVRVFDSQANFVLLELDGADSPQLTAQLVVEQVYVRDCASMGMGSRFVRVAVGSRETNARLINALAACRSQSVVASSQR